MNSAEFGNATLKTLILYSARARRTPRDARTRNKERPLLHAAWTGRFRNTQRETKKLCKYRSASRKH